MEPRMGKMIDKFTVTFYDEAEIKISNEFRKLLMARGESANETLKKLIVSWIKDHR